MILARPSHGNDNLIGDHGCIPGAIPLRLNPLRTVTVLMAACASKTPGRKRSNAKLWCCTGCAPNNQLTTNAFHYGDVIMSVMASQITGVSIAIVYSIVCSGPDQRKHQSSASLAFERGIHRWLVNSPHKGPLTRKMLPFDEVIMWFGLFIGYHTI